MKPISLESLPNLHEITNEDPNSFFFEFYLLCCSYEYTDDFQKLKLFPTTLKGLALRLCCSVLCHLNFHFLYCSKLKKMEYYVLKMRRELEILEYLLQ